MNKNTLQIGDILESDEKNLAYVNKIFPDKIQVWSKEYKKEYISDEKLQHWKYANPIKENRIISSYTFAVRFKQFLEWIPKSWWMSQPHYYDEFEYMMNVANQLLKYQIQTVTEQEEINYLKRLELL